VARLLTDATRETNMSPRSIILTGAGILALFIGSFALWAWLAPLHSAVITQGEITFKGKRQSVQHLEGGIVKRILVKDGDTVKAGQPLILLEDDQVRPMVAMIENQSATEAAAIARLEAEKNNQATVVFPKGTPTNAAQTETKLFMARKEAFQSQIEVLKSQIEQTHEGIKGLQDQLVAKGQEISSLKEQLDSNRTLLKDGYVTKTSVLELERMLAQKVGEREQISAGISSNKQRLAELNQRIISLKTDRIQNAVTEQKLSTVKQLELKERVRPSRDTLERQVIRAPVSGIVVGLKIATIGGVVMPREPLMEIAPQSDDLYLEAKVMVNDISDLKVGQEAEVTISAFKSSSTPPVKAKLTYISADRLTLRTAQGEMPYYDVQLVFDKESLKLLGDQKLVPGMTAQATIATKPRTAMDYFIAPLRDRMGKAFHAK
jgi:membrane fusion protein, epimerase transport system